MSVASFSIDDATADALGAINDLYNDEILHGTATWDDEPWSLARRRLWFEALRRDSSTPILVTSIGADFAGFGYLSAYRPRSGYRFTRESTLYVPETFRRQGVGRLLLGALVERAHVSGVHALLAVIEAENAPSIALHEATGFEVVGHQRETGFKFGRWLDAITMELLIS